MEVRDAIFSRRAIRHYADRPLEPEVVKEILLAAVQAPSAMNRQPWSFAVFHGRQRLAGYSTRAKEQLLAVLPGAFTFSEHSPTNHFAAESFNIFYDAETLVVISALPSDIPLLASEDCCLAAQNLMLAAWDRGVGSCPIGFARPWLALPATKEELGIPPTHTPIFAVILGYPAESPPAPPRREPEITAWRWD